MINSASHQPTWLFAGLICNKSDTQQKTATSLLFFSCCFTHFPEARTFAHQENIR